MKTPDEKSNQTDYNKKKKRQKITERKEIKVLLTAGSYQSEVYVGMWWQ